MIRFLIDGAREIVEEMEIDHVAAGYTPHTPEEKREIARMVLREHIEDIREGDRELPEAENE